MKRVLSNSLSQKLIITILASAVIVLFLQTLARANGGYDFSSFLETSKALLSNGNPYLTSSPFLYKYPLFLGVILIPFTFLPYILDNVLWFFLNLGSFVIIVYLLLRIFHPSLLTRYDLSGILFLLFLTLFSPMQNHLLNGQINFIVLLFCTLFIINFDKHEILASFFLSIAVSIKIVPLIFIIFLIVEKKYSSIFFVVLFIIILNILIPLAFTGDKLWGYYDYFLSNFIFYPITHSSDPSLASRYFSLSGFLHNIFDVSGIVLQIFSALFIMIPIIILHYSGIKNNRRNKTLVSYGMYTIAMLLLSPSSQPHHLVFIIPSLIIIIISIYERSLRWREYSVIYFLVFFVLFWIGNIFRTSPLIFISIFSLYLVNLLYGIYGNHLLKISESEV